MPLKSMGKNSSYFLSFIKKCFKKQILYHYWDPWIGKRNRAYDNVLLIQHIKHDKTLRNFFTLCWPEGWSDIFLGS
jgi:hypothetical protein